MRDDYSRFRDAGGDVALVTMGTPEQAAAFRARYRLPFRCLSDPEQAAYRAFGLPRGGLGAVAGPAMWLAGFKAILRHGLGRVVGDPYQLPGDFIIDTGGILRHVHRAAFSTDTTPNDELIRILHEVHGD